MKPFTRLILKKGYEEWGPIISLKGGPGKVFDSCMKRDFPFIECIKVRSSNYHGVIELDTPYFIILKSTFPCMLENVKEGWSTGG